MRPARIFGFLFLLAAAIGEPAELPLAGRVSTGNSGISGALVVLWDAVRATAIPVLTEADGVFRLAPLPAGIYRIVAMKRGFLPAAVERSHPGGKLSPVELTLAPTGLGGALPAAPTGGGVPIEEIWRIRASLPPDLLRQLDLPGDDLSRPETAGLLPPNNSDSTVAGSVSAFAGRPAEATSAGAGEMTSTRLGVGGGLPGGGRWKLDAGWGRRARMTTGLDSDAALSLDVEATPRQVLRWKSRQTELDGEDGIVRGSRERIQSHTLNWEGKGEQGERALLAARLVEEGLPESETGREPGRLVEISAGASFEASADTDLGALVRLRQEQPAAHDSGDPTSNERPVMTRSIDLLANGRTRLSSSWTIEYGATGAFEPGRAAAGPTLAIAVEPRGIGRISISGRGKFHAADGTTTGPTVPVFLDEEESLERSERWSWGVEWTLEGEEELPGSTSTVASISFRNRELDHPARIFLTAELGGAFDDVSLAAGTTLRQLEARFGKRLGPIEGEARVVWREADEPGQLASGPDRTEFGEASMTARLLPTGTELRFGRAWKRREASGTDHRARFDRTELRVAQRLPFPSAWPAAVRLLVGAEQARGDRADFDLEGSGTAVDRRWLGGLSVEF
jgi:hypothetical protein